MRENRILVAVFWVFVCIPISLLFLLYLFLAAQFILVPGIDEPWTELNHFIAKGIFISFPVIALLILVGFAWLSIKEIRLFFEERKK